MKHLNFTGIPVSHGESFYTVRRSRRRAGSDYYFLSNDALTYGVESVSHMQNGVFIGIGNPHFFHVLSVVLQRGIALRRIIAVDANYTQLCHFDIIRRMICASSNRIEFLQRLFCVRFNARAIDLLERFCPFPRYYVHGAYKQSEFYDIESQLWAHSVFDSTAFSEKYRLEAERCGAGLKISSRTVGDINTYYATFICGDRESYDSWPFTIGFGSGFLYDEDAFSQLKSALEGVPVYQICGDIVELFEPLSRSHRYNPLYVWSSNLFCDYFMNKFEPLRALCHRITMLGAQCEPQFPELDIVLIQDEREKLSAPQQIDTCVRHERPWSIHTNSFHKIIPYMNGKRCIEVVNMRNWIENDGGQSKLANCEYMYIDDFINLSEQERFDTIFIHILAGHGMRRDDCAAVLRKAQRICSTLLVLEHNRASSDFCEQGIGLTRDEIRDILGMESAYEYCPGETCEDRNLLMVYRA